MLEWPLTFLVLATDLCPILRFAKGMASCSLSWVETPSFPARPVLTPSRRSLPGGGFGLAWPRKIKVRWGRFSQSPPSRVTQKWGGALVPCSLQKGCLGRGGRGWRRGGPPS